MSLAQKLAPAYLEDWLRDNYFTAGVDIGSSGVQNYSFAELLALIGLTHEELDPVMFDDGRSLGTPGLRQAIATRWGDGDPRQVMVTHGASEAMFLVMQTLLQLGDEVVVLDPCYYPLTEIAAALGCVLKVWPLRFEHQFTPDLTVLKGLLSPQTRMVIVNFPHNPTGASLTAEQQSELLALVTEAGAYLVWDQTFAELTYGHAPLPNPHLQYERAITLGTLSKAYGLAGLRVGWCFAPPDILDQCAHLRDYTTVFLSPLIELIGQRAVEHADRLLAKRSTQARANLQILLEWAVAHADLVDWVSPQGGVTAFPRFHAIDNTDALCRHLLADGVLLVPGSCFHHARHVRIGFGGPSSSLRSGLMHLSRHLVTSASPASSQ